MLVSVTFGQIRLGSVMFFIFFLLTVNCPTAKNPRASNYYVLIQKWMSQQDVLGKINALLIVINSKHHVYGLTSVSI